MLKIQITDEALIPDKFKSVTLKMPAQVWHEHIARHNEMRMLFAPADVDSFPEKSRIEREAFVSYEISKTALAKAIKAGEQIPGADLQIGKQRLERR